MKKVVTLFLAMIAISGFVLLGGCNSTFKYAECIVRDNTSNPCNW